MQEAARAFVLEVLQQNFKIAGSYRGAAAMVETNATSFKAILDGSRDLDKCPAVVLQVALKYPERQDELLAHLRCRTCKQPIPVEVLSLNPLVRFCSKECRAPQRKAGWRAKTADRSEQTARGQLGWGPEAEPPWFNHVSFWASVDWRGYIP